MTDVATHRLFSAAGVDDVGVPLAHRDRADGPAEEPVRDVAPALAPIRGLPHTAAGGAHVVRVRITVEAADRGRAAAAVRTDLAEREALQEFCWGRPALDGDGSGGQGEGAGEGEEHRCKVRLREPPG